MSSDRQNDAPISADTPRRPSVGRGSAGTPLPPDLEQALRGFGCVHLGEGDLVAGINTLVAMALTLAAVSSPRSSVVLPNGSMIGVGLNFLVAGERSRALIEEHVTVALREAQGRLTNHVWHDAIADKRNGPPRYAPDKVKGIRLRNNEPPIFKRLDLVHPPHPSDVVNLFRGSDEVHQGVGKRHDTFFVEGAEPLAMQRAIRNAHSGRVHAVICLNQPKDVQRFCNLYHRLKNGFSIRRPAVYSIEGSVMTTVREELLSEIANQGSKGPHWLRELLWLRDGATEHHIPDRDVISAIVRSFKLSLHRLMGLRYRHEGPTTCEAGVALEHARCLAEFSTMEARHPGVAGCWRALYASLLYGLRGFTKVPGQDSLKSLAFDLAVWLARRSIEHSGAVFISPRPLRAKELARAIFLKMEDRPASAREIQRRFHSLSSQRCFAGLSFLENCGLVVCTGRNWQRSVAIRDGLDVLDRELNYGLPDGEDYNE